MNVIEFIGEYTPWKMVLTLNVPPLYPHQTNPCRTGIHPAGDSLAAYELTAIRNALSKCGNNRARAARMLGIGEATLYRKIKKLEIDF